MKSEALLAQPVLGASRIAVNEHGAEFTFHTIGGQWTVSGRFTPAGERLQLRQLSIDAGATAEHLTTKSLQTIPLGVLLEAVQHHQLTQPARSARRTTGRPTTPGPPATEAPRRRGRPSRRDQDLKGVAEDFLRIQDSGITPVMEELARQRAWPVATTRGWVQRRNQGRLVGTPHPRQSRTNGRAPPPTSTHPTGNKEATLTINQANQDLPIGLKGREDTVPATEHNTH